MTRLNKNWITEGLIDFEYKKYMLLGYLKNVKSSFVKVELYPEMSDLVDHFHYLKDLRNTQEHVDKQMSKDIIGWDKNTLKVIYEKLSDNNKTLKEIKEIVNFAIPQIENCVREGKEIYEFVESNCQLEPIGLLPLYTDEGYLLLRGEGSRQTNIYRYQMTVFENTTQRYRGMHVGFIDRFQHHIGTTYESIKKHLISTFKDLPNPATYLVESKIEVPLERTLLPIAKRLLVRNIAAA